MKRIALIKCSGSLNIGNEFINAGGKYVVQTIFPEMEILEYEFFDTAIKQSWKYPSPALLDWAKQQIETCDLMVVCSGCIISKYTANVLEELAQIKVKKVLLGAGAYQYDDYDKKLSKKLIDMYDLIFTRDDISFSFFENAPNVYSGLDMAFFVPNAINNPKLDGDYALINLDLIWQYRKQIERYRQSLQNDYPKVYIVENTTVRNEKTKNFLYCGYWDTLYKTISHARYVVTNRIHTVVCCLINQVPFMLTYGEPTVADRSSLFKRFGFTLLTDKKYSKEELMTYQDKIRTEKEQFLAMLKNVLEKELEA